MRTQDRMICYKCCLRRGKHLRNGKLYCASCAAKEDAKEKTTAQDLIDKARQEKGGL